MKKVITKTLRVETDLQSEDTHPVMVLSTFNGPVEILSLTYAEAVALSVVLNRHADGLARAYAKRATKKSNRAPVAST